MRVFEAGKAKEILDEGQEAHAGADHRKRPAEYTTAGRVDAARGLRCLPHPEKQATESPRVRTWGVKHARYTAE